MKKRLIAAVLCVIMAGTLTACGQEISNEYVTIKQHKGLEVAQVEMQEVTDAYVENTIQSYLGVSLDTDRKAEDGDTVGLDYVGKIDGVEFDGGSAQGAKLELGSGQFIGANGKYKGFEEQIVGHMPGETFDINVQFPDDYQQPDYAGKAAVFTITLNGIYPELTDEWVQGISEKSKTVEEFRKEIRENIENNYKEQAEYQLQQEAMEAFLENVDVKELPKEQVDAEIAQMDEYYKSVAEQYQVDFATLLSDYMNMDEEEYAEKAKEAAETAVTRKIACELLAQKKNLEPSEKEMEKMIKEFAEQSGYEDVESFQEAYGEDVVKDAVLQRKVMEYLAKNCVQVEADESAE